MKQQLSLIILILIGIFYACSGPMYEPGMISGEVVFTPQGNTIDQQDGFLTMEEGIDIYYFSEGKGEPVLMIHGGPGYPFGASWKGLDSLVNDFRFIYYHQRGCGKSTHPVDTYASKNYFLNLTDLQANLGLETQIKDIERIRIILGEDRITLIGHSFGGFMASLYAIEYPQRVKSLILVSPADVIKMPSGNGGLYDQVEKRLPVEMKKEYHQYLDKFFDYKNIFKKSEKELSELNGEFNKYFYAAYDISDEQLESSTQSINIGGWHMHALFFSMGKKHDYSEAFKAIQAPVLVIHGEHDIMPLESVTVYNKLIEGSTLNVIEGAGHFSFNEQPVVFGDIAGEFLKGEIE